MSRSTDPGTPRGADDWVERVRAASDIVEVIGQTVTLRRSGRNWVGLCPFHEEKTPSFSVNAERQFYHCFSCKVGGDVFKFVQETEHLGFVEAVEWLSRRAGIPVPERRGAPRGQRTRLLEALEAATVAYEQWLADPEAGAVARAYLERRGLTRDTIRAFRLGFVPDGWEHLTRRLSGRVGDDALIESGLASRREGGRGGLYDRFRHRLMIPLIAPGGAVLGFGARAMRDSDPPKYLNSPETPVYHKGSFLFGAEQARRAEGRIEDVFVVEGYFDAIALHQAGLTRTVATSGTALTPDQAKLLQRLAPRVTMAYDGDQAGRGAMLRSLAVLLAEGLEVRVIDLPQGDDPDTLVRREGTVGWERAQREALDPVAFVQKHVFATAGPGDPLERAVQTIVELAGSIEDPVRTRILLDRATAVFGIPVQVLQRAVALRSRGQGVDHPVRAVVAERRRGERDLEHRLLQALLMAPGALEEARGLLSPEDFGSASGRALAVRLWRGEAGDEEDAEASALERELLAEVSELADWEAEARAITRAMLGRRLKVRLNERKEALRRAADEEEAVRLMREIEEIGASLRALHG
jgi:DNA primase